MMSQLQLLRCPASSASTERRSPLITAGPGTHPSGHSSVSVKLSDSTKATYGLWTRRKPVDKLTVLMKLSLSLAVLCLTCSSASAATIVYAANLSGLNEAPPNASPAIGNVLVTIDTTLNTMRVQASFSGLQGNSTAAHIHAPTVTPGSGVVTPATRTPSFIGFPIGVTAGSMDQTYDLTLASTYNAVFITANLGVAGAQAALLAAMEQGRSYFNIHSGEFPGGEIRGFLTPVPEPSTYGLVLGAAALAAFARRRRS